MCFVGLIDLCLQYGILFLFYCEFTDLFVRNVALNILGSQNQPKQFGLFILLWFKCFRK